MRLKLEPLAEEGYRQLARLYYLLGDRGAALATLECCRRMMKEELGTSPLKETLELATPLELKPLGAEALVRKAQALLKLLKLEEAREVIKKALTYQAVFVSPAEIRFTAYQIYEALGDAKVQDYLEAAQTWIDEMARALPKDLQKTFLNQALHKKIL